MPCQSFSPGCGGPSRPSPYPTPPTSHLFLHQVGGAGICLKVTVLQMSRKYAQNACVVTGPETKEIKRPQINCKYRCWRAVFHPYPPLSESRLPPAQPASPMPSPQQPPGSLASSRAKPWGGAARREERIREGLPLAPPAPHTEPGSSWDSCGRGTRG